MQVATACRACLCSLLQLLSTLQRGPDALATPRLGGLTSAGDFGRALQCCPSFSIAQVLTQLAHVLRALAALQALQRADQIEYAEGKVTRDYFLPIVADAGELHDSSWPTACQPCLMHCARQVSGVQQRTVIKGMLTSLALDSYRLSCADWE